MPKTSLTISRLAKRVGMGVETIRYYQRIGLMETPPKPLKGYRTYPQESVSKLKFILRAKQLGFSLAEIKELLLLDKQACDKTQKIAERKISLIQEKIADLQNMSTMLKNLLQSCKENQSTGHCPIIQVLSKDEKTT